MSSHKHTRIWYSKEFVEQVKRLLEDNTYGFRLYFATRDKKNELIWVLDYFLLFDTLNSATVMGKGERRFKRPLKCIATAADSICTNSICNRSDHSISCIQGRKMVNAFRGGEITTYSVWYDAELIRYWSYELAAAERKVGRGCGLRMYYAGTEDNTQTIVMLTTRPEGLLSKCDYYDCYSTYFREVIDQGHECPNNCCVAEWKPDEFECSII